jgi:hypothetical protein
VSDQDDFFLNVEKAVAEHKRMNLVPEIPDIDTGEKEFKRFKSDLKELHSIPKEELERRWAELQNKKNINRDKRSRH